MPGLIGIGHSGFFSVQSDARLASDLGQVEHRTCPSRESGRRCPATVASQGTPRHLVLFGHLEAVDEVLVADLVEFPGVNFERSEDVGLADVVADRVAVLVAPDPQGHVRIAHHFRRRQEPVHVDRQEPHLDRPFGLGVVDHLRAELAGLPQGCATQPERISTQGKLAVRAGVSRPVPPDLFPFLVVLGIAGLVTR